MDEPVALRILFADDDEAFRHLLRVRLDQIPEVEIVAEAADGAEAVELALALRPEFVLLDIAMPRLDGFEAATRIQESLPQAGYPAPDAAVPTLERKPFEQVIQFVG